MSSAKEGLYAYIYLGTAPAVAATDTVALLTGVELSWSQTKKRFYQLGGSLHPSQVLRGIIQYNGKFTHAFIDFDLLGTLDAGTIPLYGSITPRGANSPAILGTLELVSGSLSNMQAENEAAVEEDFSFILYNISRVG
jgi:hypothetical protein